MRYFQFSIILVLAAFALNACVDPDTTNLEIAGMFSGSSPRIKERFAQSQEYNNQHGFATIQAPVDHYNVYVHTDTHVRKTTRNIETFLTHLRNDTIAPLAIHLGDVIDAQTNWERMIHAYQDFPKNPNKYDTMMVAVGNHDIYFNQWEVFRGYFATASYYFIVQTPSNFRDIYFVIDSSEGTLGVDQMRWFKDLLKWSDTQDFRHKVVCTHTHLFKRDNSQTPATNYSLEETYELLDLFSKHHIEMYWCGHDHSREISRFRNVECITLGAMLDYATPAFYMIANMGDEIDYRFVQVDKYNNP